MNTMYPFLLTYITKSPIWGGTRLLTDRWGKTSSSSTVGESWELTVREKEMSAIRNGDLYGMTLGEYFARYGKEKIGSAWNGETFPLLIKLIDATDKLSVQVHPDDAYASRVEGDRGKTEMWYIVEADPGAEIVYGLSDGVDREQFRKAVRDGRIGDVLKHQPVKPGEVYFIPSGMVHAIGAGILIAEIQQNCDLTYRIYDYDRRQPDGSLRQLHVDKALDVVRPFTDEEINKVRFAKGEEAGLFANCPYFKTGLLSGPKSRRTVSAESFLYLLCLDGTGSVTAGGETVSVRKGDSIFLPAGTGDSALDGSFLFASL